MEELEITFLPKALPEGVMQSPSKEIIDIYIPKESRHPTLRIRKSGNKYEMTKKEVIDGGDASRQLETTIPLTESEFKELNTLEGKRVQKTRYFYNENGIEYEVGVFSGELAGLVLVDVEFSSSEEKEKFQMPTWCLADVTQEDFVAGGMLCGKKYEDIEGNLQRYGYKKLV